MARLCQESKSRCDVGWKLDFGIPDEFVNSPAGLLLRYKDVLVPLSAVSDGITYEDFKARQVKGGK